MTKQDINSIVCQCAQECDSNITSREVITVLQSDLVPSMHPLREYILSCRTWTKEQPDWIDFVARQVKVKPSGEEAKGDKATGEELWRECFKRWFVAMVASWMKDEVVNQQVLVLIGRQGIYKTTWLERLIPPHLRPYSCKLANTNDLNKDERMRIAEFGLIALDEIDSMNHRELNQLKSVITSSDVNERAAYAYTKERRVRLASFCASGNRRDFLTDLTGNRRWLPFEVESIQNPYFTVLPYEMMYAQAWALAQDPTFSYWFDLDEIEVLEQHNQQFRDESNEEQLLPILFDIPAEGKGEFLTTAQISERLVNFGNIKKPMALSRLGMVLGTAGYKATKRKIGNTQTRGWIVYQRDTDEINTLRRILKE
jgi:predicted P-loop ATPase